MSSVWRVSAFLAVSLIGLIGSAGAACAQAWGEQAPVQFKYSNQGQVDEVYRNQLGTAAATAAASAAALASGGSGSGQSSSQLNNAVEVNSNNTYDVTVSGSSNYLNFGGDTVNAQQTSTGTKQASSNSTSAPATKNGSSRYLNQ
jgi:hypothetical protein